MSADDALLHTTDAGLFIVVVVVKLVPVQVPRFNLLLQLGRRSVEIDFKTTRPLSPAHPRMRLDWRGGGR